MNEVLYLKSVKIIAKIKLNGKEKILPPCNLYARDGIHYYGGSQSVGPKPASASHAGLL